MYNKEIKILIGLKNGYYQFRDREHPLAYKSDASVYVHRHSASIKIGRWLKPEEHVHHLDGNKLNNDPSNLEVLSNSEHAKLHNPSMDTGVEKGKLVDLYLCEFCNQKYLPWKASVAKRFCSIQCSSSATIKDKTITKEMLNELIPFNSWVSLAKIFGYSDNGIKKRAKALGCDITKINTMK